MTAPLAASTRQEVRQVEMGLRFRSLTTRAPYVVQKFFGIDGVQWYP